MECLVAYLVRKFHLEPRLLRLFWALAGVPKNLLQNRHFEVIWHLVLSPEVPEIRRPLCFLVAPCRSAAQPPKPLASRWQASLRKSLDFLTALLKRASQASHCRNRQWAPQVPVCRPLFPQL